MGESISQTDPKVEPATKTPIESDQMKEQVLDLASLNIKPFDYKIFPLQVKSHLQVILPNSENFTMRLLDLYGNVLFTHFEIFGENQVNLGHLKSATYFVEISSKHGKIIEEIKKT